jgi:tRNA pseudouridine65 synthase
MEKESKTIFRRLAVASVVESGTTQYFCTLVAVEPVTGRTHQIRRHAFALGMPILGDTQHGDTKVNRWWRERFANFQRLALHCLAIDNLELHSDHSQGETIVAPLPAKTSNIFFKVRT